MVTSIKKDTLGVLGGMGALASAEFVRTIYEVSPDLRGREQDGPSVILISDPGFPDRTEAFLKGDDEPLLEMLIASLGKLVETGASKIVICCMTMHYLLPRLPPSLRERVISMLDVIFRNLGEGAQPYLLISSSGTRKLRLFENHPKWPTFGHRFIFPNEGEQQNIHRLIYEVKKNRRMDETIAFLKHLLSKYETDTFIAGCSEVHLIAKQFMKSAARNERFACIDPLSIIARDLTENRL